MSTPPFLTLPAGARPVRLVTARGSFATLEALPEGRPQGTALLVPGFTGSKEDFIGLLDPLAKAGFRVVAADQRGQYETGGPADEAVYSLPELAADVLAITEAAGAGGRVHLLGHSFGGYVVREAVLAAAGATAAALPWRSLTLLSTGPAAIEPTEAARTKLLLDALQTMDLEGIWQIMRQLDEGDDNKADPATPEVLEFLHRRWLSNVPQSLTAMARRLLSETDRAAELAAIDLPKLVVSGTQDYAWPVPWQTAMAERLGARRVIVQDAGHSPNAERPAETARALLDFWSATGL